MITSFYIATLVHFHHLWYFLRQSFELLFKLCIIYFLAIVLSLQIHLSFWDHRPFHLYFMYITHLTAQCWRQRCSINIFWFDLLQLLLVLCAQSGSTFPSVWYKADSPWYTLKCSPELIISEKHDTLLNFSNLLLENSRDLRHRLFMICTSFG